MSVQLTMSLGEFQNLVSPKRSTILYQRSSPPGPNETLGNVHVYDGLNEIVYHIKDDTGSTDILVSVFLAAYPGATEIFAVSVA